MVIRLSIEPGKQLREKVVVQRGKERTVMFAKDWREDNGMCLTTERFKFEKSVFKRDATLKLVDGAFLIYSSVRKQYAVWKVPYDDPRLRTKAFAREGGITIDLDGLAWGETAGA